MENDIFTEMYETLGGGQPEGNANALHIRLGTVLAVEPLTVDVGGTTQEADRFYLCDRLRAGHAEKVSPAGNLSITASCPNGSHTNASVNSGTLTVTQRASPLAVKDAVLLLTEDDQIFFLIDKVVHL